MTSFPNREGVGAKIKEQPQTMLVPEFVNDERGMLTLSWNK
jgi:hypothetical protein